jgi:hypothetical protein
MIGPPVVLSTRAKIGAWGATAPPNSIPVGPGHMLPG